MQTTVTNAVKNQTEPNDRPFHSWYQFVLGFPPHFVRYCVSKFDVEKRNLVLDPFCGTGTTNVECKKLGIDSLGLEANPMTKFAACVKTNWEILPDDLEASAHKVALGAIRTFKRFRIAEYDQLSQERRQTDDATVSTLEKEPELTEAQEKILPKDFISELPLRKVLILKELIDQVENREIQDALLLALANVTVKDASNLAFGPEIYTSTPLKEDAAVVSNFLVKACAMAKDLRTKPSEYGTVQIELGDARHISDCFHKGRQIDCVVTSPPYPNEKDYTRITRLESIVLGFVKDRESLRAVKANLLRSNSRNIFVSDTDDEFVKGFRPIEELARKIERKRISLRKKSGFEKMYHKIVTHYFGGMYRHFESLKKLLEPHAKLAYVVGDQMSFFRINIPTAELLGKIAEHLGYRVERIELWRTRLATATKIALNENILVLSNEG